MNRDRIFKMDEISSFPKGFVSIISEYLPVICPYFSGKAIKGYFDVCCALDVNDFWNNPLLVELKEKALFFLRDYKIYAYHNTRLLSIDEFMLQGLRPLGANDYLKRMRMILEQSSFSAETDSLLKLTEPLLQDERGGRSGLISFYTSLSQFDRYSKFTLNVGGEVAEFAYYARKDVLGYLSGLGTPVIVEFALPVENIHNYRHDYFITELVRAYYSETYLSVKYTVEFNATTGTPIQPEDILQIIPLNNGVTQ